MFLSLLNSFTEFAFRVAVDLDLLGFSCRGLIRRGFVTSSTSKIVPSFTTWWSGWGIGGPFWGDFGAFCFGVSDPCCRAMDSRGAASSQGRSAWNKPLRTKPDGGASESVVASRVPVKNPPLSFASKPAVQNTVYSSSDEDSESGGDRNVDALESSIMADYPTTGDMDDTGAASFLSMLSFPSLLRNSWRFLTL